MTPKERLLAVFRGEKPDRLPWAPLIDNYFFSSLPQETQGIGYAAFAESMGFDLLRRHAPVAQGYYEAPVREAVRQQGTKVETVLHTPLGDLRQIVEHHSGTQRYLEHFIKTPSELSILAYAMEHRQFRPCYDQFNAIQTEIGDRGLAVATVPASPLALLHEEYMGLEPTIYALFDEQERMEAAMAVIHRAHLRELALAVRSPAPAIFSYEDTSSTTISRDMYERYCLPALSDYAARCAQEGKPYVVHMCGKLSAFRDLVAQTPCFGLDSICPPGSGDMQLWEARGAWPNRLILGGIEPAAMALLSPSALRERVACLLERIEGMDGLVLCTGDAVAHGTPVENFLVVSRLLGRI